VTKLGILVGEDLWTFFDEIFADLSDHYTVEVYKKQVYNIPLLRGRLNRWAFRHGLQSMLRRNDICFFEWASDLLVHASHMPKQCAIVTRLHSFELYQWAPKINWDTVDKVILVSEAMREIFVEQYPSHAHKTEVVYNGRNLEHFYPAGQKEFGYELGMVCRITPIKRVYEVILMLHGLREQGVDARLHIAGEPDGDRRYAAAVYRLVEKLGLKDHVIFYGHVTDTPHWLHQIDIFISNSYWEGQQVALLEAMAAGCYCLSHYWAGADEMLPAENLYVTESELQQKIVEYGAIPASERLRRQAHLRSLTCEKFDTRQTQAHIRQIIAEISGNLTQVQVNHV
jgi:glycosyltransferase involved in cell wall biosynthesis